jgi:phage baseplate assembly protein W
MANNNPLLEEDNNPFLGRGWSFPPTFERGYNGVDMLNGETDVQSSLEILLTTQIGERVMRPEYGTAIKDSVFDIIDVSTSTYLAYRLKRVILLHEPRIFVDDITFNQDVLNGIIELRVDYTIISSNTRSNFVFPFYFTEGTDLLE